jgi:hypothetical protein
MPKEIRNNPERCSCFGACSINVCPLDPEAHLRSKLPEENSCPFCLKKKSKSQKGMRTLMPSRLLEFVPKSNIKMLNRRNQKRWRQKIYENKYNSNNTNNKIH